MKKMRNLVAAGMMAISLMAGTTNVMACIGEGFGFYYNDSDYGVDPATYNSGYTFDGYILPYSSSMYYTSADLAGLSNVDLLIARNEIYAKHGRLFNDWSIQQYFNNQSWYYGSVLAENFSESVFNDCERANINLIVAEERARGSQVTNLEGYF